MKLSKNFTLEELIASPTATRLKIDNTPSQDVIRNLQQTVTYILQPARNHFGPLKVNSGYRSPELNVAIGGAKNSDHTRGQAVDFEVPGTPNNVLAQWVADNCPYDQIILEFFITGQANSGWVHASYTPTPRRKLLIAHKDGKKTVYREVRSF
jgi:zinc D-Ala-D-Ala carboxypeptidase